MKEETAEKPAAAEEPKVEEVPEAAEEPKAEAPKTRSRARAAKK